SVRSEDRALGVDFGQRNALFDEALAVLRGGWSQDKFAYEGTGFPATEVTANPKPAHVPIWIGGNSALTRRRVAAHGDGWNPFPAPPMLARTARTPQLTRLDHPPPLLPDPLAGVHPHGPDPQARHLPLRTRAAAPRHTSL